MGLSYLSGYATRDEKLKGNLSSGPGEEHRVSVCAIDVLIVLSHTSLLIVRPNWYAGGQDMRDE